MTAIEPAFLVDKDYGALDVPKLARNVTRQHGKSAGRQMREAIRLQLGAGRVSMAEYYDMRLYDDGDLSGDKRQFMGIAGIRKLWERVNRPNWLLGDKLAFPFLMKELGFPVEPIAAIYGDAARAKRLERLASPDALRAFLLNRDNYPVFGKPINSSMSRGAEGYVSVDPTGAILTTLSGRTIPVDAVVATIAEHYGDGGYIFQRQILPHRDIRALSNDKIASLRIVTLRTDITGILGVAWKLPTGNNVADNFWRPGNILAEVNLESGTVSRAYRGSGLQRELLKMHPDSGATLTGFELPFWNEALQLAKDAAELFDDCPMIGWDIAITDEGPLILEGNGGPDLRLLQHATRRGVNNEMMADFLQWRKSRMAENRHGRRKAIKEAVVDNFRLSRQRQVRSR